jgi:hypothetical protein
MKREKQEEETQITKRTNGSKLSSSLTLNCNQLFVQNNLRTLAGEYTAH